MESEFRTFFGVSQNNYTLQLSSQRQCPFSKIHQASSVSKLSNYHPVRFSQHNEIHVQFKTEFTYPPQLEQPEDTTFH
jgi:hypothetical protein